MAEGVFYGREWFRIQTSGRYYQSGRKDAEERLLHRRVWADSNGPIPKGMVIHHKDGNWRNNDISNLEARDRSDHASEHMFALHKERPGFGSGGLVKAREAAKAWHRSKEGLLWHSRNGQESWNGRKKVRVNCFRCGKSVWLFFKHKKSFCSSACSQRMSFRTYFTDARKCRNCQKEFMANRHRPTMYCSRLCSNRHRFSK